MIRATGRDANGFDDACTVDPSSAAAYVTGSPDESPGNEDGVAVGGRLAGRNADATSPITPTAARTTIASAYERSGDEVMPATRTVPAMAAPRDEPRLDTLRERPEISPCSSSAKLDCTTLTDGVSIKPSPSPIRSSPGANAQTLGRPITIANRTPTPPIVTRKPPRIRVRCARRLANRSAARDAANKPRVSAVKISPVSMAS